MLISDGINHGKLQSIIVGELKKAGLKHRFKKIILKNVKDHKTVFGAPLMKVPSCSVICCGSTLCIPIVVSEMSSVLRANAHVEGLFRKAGSQTRQKDIKRLLDAGGCVSEGHHPIDVASVLKLYLRCLPEPLISAEVQDLLLRCRVTAGEGGLKPILNTLLLLPVLHVHLLHYIMELLNFIASRHNDNLMDSSNLAIVLAPSIMPLPATSSAQRLEHHVALVKIFIDNARYIGLLSDDLMTKLDDDSDVSQSRRKKRRSGSLNRMLSGLRKMVSGNVTTPAPVRENSKTPILSKSAAKRKFDSYEGLSTKKKKEITKNLPQKELSFTPMKMGVTERKRLRLSMMDARSTPVINTDYKPRKNSETSISSEDLLTSSENLFSAHDTIDLSPDMKLVDKDYVRISKQEYEEIKSRVSAIENRLSREFTDVIPRVQPLQQVQNVYEQTLEDVAMLNCPSSEHLARRLSKELKIRPKEEAKIIRSPSARKIGSIRRRSKENLTKIVRHKSWNASSHSQASQIADRFYPYIGISRRERTNVVKPNQIVPKTQNSSADWDVSASENSNNASDASQKYHQRRRISLIPDFGLNKTIGKAQARRSLNLTMNSSWDATCSDTSANDTLNSNVKSRNSAQFQCFQNVNVKNSNQVCKEKPSNSHQKWRNAAAFFMNKTGELESSGQSGRPSVNKLRRQNAGAVMAKAKLFESSSDKSSELSERVVHTGFARKPRINQPIKTQKTMPQSKSRLQAYENIDSSSALKVSNHMNCNASNVTFLSPKSQKEEIQNLRKNRKTTPTKKMVSPQQNLLIKTPQPPALKKPLCTPRSLKTPALNNEGRKINTPMRAVHISPRRSPRQKQHRMQIN